jgi:hypothetical protein
MTGYAAAKELIAAIGRFEVDILRRNAEAVRGLASTRRPKDHVATANVQGSFAIGQ